MIRYGLAILLILSLILTAGCTSAFSPALLTTNTTANATPVPTPSVALYKVTVAQPDAYSRFIRMDSDIFNVGEVVEFVVVNDGPSDLKSPNDDPKFSVTFQTGSGMWATKMGNGKPLVTNASRLRPGASSKVYRFLTEGWEAGRYRIVSDYGTERDFLIRAAQKPAPAQPADSTPVLNSTPWITLDAIPDHYAGEMFTISGKTNIPAGRELRYQIFSPGSDNTILPLGEPVSITVAQGPPGNNTWSVYVMMPEPSLYLIGIADETKKATVLQRFMILQSPGTGTGMAPAEPVAIGTPLPSTPRVLP